jgi:hypothetical protein
VTTVKVYSLKCLLPGHGRRLPELLYHKNRGATLVWCRKHGVVGSIFAYMDKAKSDRKRLDRQMPKRLYNETFNQRFRERKSATKRET